MSRTPFLPRMKNKVTKKRAIQVEVEEELYLKVRHLLDQRSHTWHDLVELALLDYIEEVKGARKT